MSQVLTHVGLGLNIDNSIGFIHGSGLPGSSGGNPDLVNKGSLYVNDIDGALWKKISDGSGTGRWREVTYGTAPKGLNNFSGIQVIDYAKVDDVGLAKWVVEVSLSNDTSNKYMAEVTAFHNGTASADATVLDFNEYGILQVGTIIPGLSIQSGLSGTGIDQLIELRVGATQNINVLARRVSFSDSVSSTTALDLTTVPHDISSSILGAVVPNEPILFFVPSRTFKLPANFTNSKAVCSTAGLTQTVFTVYKAATPTFSDVSIGTITFAANTKIGVFSASAEHTISGGDILKVVSPASPAEEIKNICITIQANYT